MRIAHRALLDTLFRRAVAAADPLHCVPPYLPSFPGDGRIVVLAAGKAAGAMAEAAERQYAGARIGGLAVTRPGYARPTRHIRMVEAGHPIPDRAGLAATTEVMALARSASAADLVLVLISGGASSAWIAPCAGVTLADKKTITGALLARGAPIRDINAVRKHLSVIKGGRLAALASPARLVTLAISDVPGDEPAVIGSGPTVPDPGTLADARAVLARYSIEAPPGVAAALADLRNETPKPADPAFAGATYVIVARPADALKAAAGAAREGGYEPILLGDALEGEARAVARQHADLALRARAQDRRAVILSGGELTVSVRGGGHGGPNQEYALALAIALDGIAGISALAADTDGIDGGRGRPDDPAGAYVDAGTLARARARGLDPAAFLADNDSTTFFRQLGDLVQCGPTHTNVNDFRAIVIDIPESTAHDAESPT